MDLATWHSLDLDDEDWQRELKNEHTASVELGGNASIPQWAHPIVTTDADSEPFPPYFTPTNDFTSQQAAQALTVLAQPPSSRDFHTDNFPDCCQPCDQQCDPDDIFPCFTIDSVPCYDTRCSQTCELDGVNTLCNDAHTEGVKQTLCCLHEGCTFQTYDEAELLHHCTLAHACGGRTHWECRNHTASGSSLHQSHVHNEHCRDDEFINPLLLHPDGCSRKSAMPPHPHMHTSIKLCNHGKHHGHGFDIQSHSPPHLKRYCNFSDHQGHHDIHASNVTRRTKKAKGKLGHIDRVPSNSSQEFSETTSPTELSVASPLNSTCFESIGAVSDADFTADQTFTCCWVADEAVGPCLATFNTAFELQTHVEEFHLASKEQQTGSKKGGSIICRWQDCPYAQSRKSWRQVQHLKDHLRTHTKRESMKTGCYNMTKEW